MIPKILHLTYRTHALPEKYEKHVELWKTTYPDWKISYASNKEVFDFFETYFPQYTPFLSKIPTGGGLADVYRYAILYIHGGMYTDIDTRPLKKISESWLSFNAVVGYEYQPKRFACKERPAFLKDTFCQWTLLSAPGCAIFKKALDECFVRLKAINFHYHTALDALKTTGPPLFSSIMQEFLNDSRILILDMDAFASDNLLGGKTIRSVVEHDQDGRFGWVLQVEAPHLSLFREGP